MALSGRLSGLLGWKTTPLICGGINYASSLRDDIMAAQSTTEVLFVCEVLEQRRLLTADPSGQLTNADPLSSLADQPSATSAVMYPALGMPAPPLILGPDDLVSPTGYTPAQIRTGYGINQIAFGAPGAIAGDGAGQTIAIIDAYDTPTIAHDLAAFDSFFNIPAPPSFTRVAQDGTANYPTTDPTGDWETETALDVEWAHATAPGANILLVEADSPVDLYTAVDFARHQAAVSVISMSFGARNLRKMHSSTRL